MTISAATPDELAEALAILYGPGSESQVGQAFRMVARGELRSSDLLVARSESTVVGAVFARLMPGCVAVIWPPRAVGDDVVVEDELTAAAVQHVNAAKAVQAFLPPEEMQRAEPLLRAGFRHVTRVWQMERPSSLSPRFGARGVGGEGVGARPGKNLLSVTSGPSPRTLNPSPPEAGGEGSRNAIPYAECDPTVFHATLLRAHENSLDCSELNRVLTPPDVLAGYQDAAPDTSRWLLALDRDEPAGVLILHGKELCFLGVVPEHRGRGIGRFLLDRAVELEPNLCLNVDVRNAPAFQLYRSADFEFVGAREVFFYFTNSSNDTTAAKVFRT